LFGSMVLVTALLVAGGEARAQPPTVPPGKLRVGVWNSDARALKALESEKDARDRERAARQLGRSQNVGVIPLLAHYAAYDPNLTVREASSAALSEIRSYRDKWTPPEFPDIDRGRGLVADKYADDRDRIQEALEALGKLKSEKKSFRREEAA